MSSLWIYCPFYPVGSAVASEVAFVVEIAAALSSLALASAYRRLATDPQDSWVRACSFDRGSSWKFKSLMKGIGKSCFVWRVFSLVWSQIRTRHGLGFGLVISNFRSASESD